MNPPRGPDGKSSTAVETPDQVFEVIYFFLFLRHVCDGLIIFTVVLIEVISIVVAFFKIITVLVWEMIFQHVQEHGIHGLIVIYFSCQATLQTLQHQLVPFSAY